jgi:hypothetical protein
LVAINWITNASPDANVLEAIEQQFQSS